MWPLFPGPFPEDAELTGWLALALDIEKIQVSQELESCFVSTRHLQQSSCHASFPGDGHSVTILALLCLYTVAVGLQESKGPEQSWPSRVWCKTMQRTLLATSETPSLCRVLPGPVVWSLLRLQVILGPSDQPDMERQLGSRNWSFHSQIRTCALEHDLVISQSWSIDHSLDRFDHLWATSVYWLKYWLSVKRRVCESWIVLS